MQILYLLLAIVHVSRGQFTVLPVQMVQNIVDLLIQRDPSLFQRLFWSNNETRSLIDHGGFSMYSVIATPESHLEKIDCGLMKQHANEIRALFVYKRLYKYCIQQLQMPKISTVGIKYKGKIRTNIFIKDYKMARLKYTRTIHKLELVSDLGESLLMAASATGNIDLAKELLELDTQINAEAFNGCTALDLAAVYGHENIARLLIDNGASINHSSKKNTPLILAAYSRNLNLLKFLVEKGANVNAQDYYGKTALMKLVENGSFEGVQFLLDHGADPYIPDKLGITAELIAEMQGHYAMFKLFNTRGLFKPV